MEEGGDWRKLGRKRRSRRKMEEKEKEIEYEEAGK